MINVRKTLFTIPLLLGLLSRPAMAQVILIDPGHGGEDCGAKTAYSKPKANSQFICEKDLALRIAKKIQQKLKKNYQVYLTRSLDRTLSL